jgi:hypothetical protein
MLTPSALASRLANTSLMGPPLSARLMDSG